MADVDKESRRPLLPQEFEKEVATTASHAFAVVGRLGSNDAESLKLQMRWSLFLTFQYAFLKLCYIKGITSAYGWIAFAALFPLINAYYSENRRTVMVITGFLALLFAVLSIFNILNVVGHVFDTKNSIILTTLTVGATFVHGMTCVTAYQASSLAELAPLVKGGPGLV